MPSDPTPLGDSAGPGWQRPSPRLRTARTVQVAATTALLMLLGLGIGFAVGGTAISLGLGAGLVAGGALWWFVLRRLRAWGYLEREDDLLVRRGVMLRRLSVVPYGRMQFVDVTAGPIERSFGLATVRMHTASAASDARIPGLEAGEAARLRDQLARLGEARAAGL
jgi:uncharacterized protein